MTATQDTLTIESLHIYPVKSLAGISLKESCLLPTGLTYDRFWMIINKNHTFISQRHYPLLALIKTALDDEYLRLSYANTHDLLIPLRYTGTADYIQGSIWGDECQLLSEGQIAADWLSDIIKQPVQLVRMQKNFKRPQQNVTMYDAKTHTFFADTSPFLICNTASLDVINNQLNKRHAASISMTNFRANIVISGITAFAEHTMSTIQHQNYSFSLRSPCQRCIVPSINPKTAQIRADKQPFALLSELNPMPTHDKKLPAFGENAILSNGNNALIRIKDTLVAQYT